MEEFALVRDGAQVRIRPFTPDDRAAVSTFFSKLSPQSRMLRFHSAGISPDTAASAARGGHVLLALDGERIVGVASYQRLRDARRAEMAIAVADADQGRGIGTVLFERLARDARAEGIRQFLALVLSHNTAMLEMLQGLGFEIAQQFDRGEIEVSVDLAEDRAYQQSADQRLHVATRASLEPIFQPRSVAVIGASRRRGTIGHELFRNLLNGGFPGPVYPVNPTTNAVASVRTYPSVKAIPDKVDLGIIVVPAPAVLDAAKDALDAGVRGLVVISAGFAEVSDEGRQLQNQLRDLCRSRGVRLIGPNCMGVLATMPGGTMNGTFLPSLPPAGSVAMASQSGALGIAVLNQARQLGIGISSFVSMGNKADVSGNDLLEWWEEDPATNVVVLYLESFGNPRRFGRVAKRVSARKPIIVIKSGRSDSGRRAAASHTAALAGSDIAVDALFKQAGVLRVESLQELFEVTTFFANQPLPRGGRVGVITNAGGLGILCADACEANGLRLPPLSEQTRQTLRSLLPAEASVINPVDMLASAPPKTYGEVLKLVHNDPNVDAVIVLFVPPLVTSAEDVAAALGPAVDPALGKP
ncbi:MAG: GNAT family N-acetyltransferase, partial [Dehalococcoidia bacterium]|nr:GNAT family N-acetyltransferase [Dehalococcoidia bacterium]